MNGCPGGFSDVQALPRRPVGFTDRAKAVQRFRCCIYRGRLVGAVVAVTLETVEDQVDGEVEAIVTGS
jgi:predicted metal-binding protein